MHTLPETIPHQIDGVVTVELFAGDAAQPGQPPCLMVEVPHGADQRAHFERYLEELTGPFPADLHEFFHVNTDVGAWQLGRAVAEQVVALDPTRSALVCRSLIPRTFIDCNRMVDAVAEGDLSRDGITGGLQPYVRDPGDIRLLIDRHRAYTQVVTRAYEWVCGAGGVALQPHTYGPRTLDVAVVDDAIITNLRRAHEPAIYDASPLRAPVDLITRDADGVRQADDQVVEAVLSRFRSRGVEAVEGAAYYLHPATMGFVHHTAWPRQVFCFEVRRDLLVTEWTPLAQQEVDPDKLAPFVEDLASIVDNWLKRRA